jgi:hypothetical protein
MGPKKRRRDLILLAFSEGLRRRSVSTYVPHDIAMLNKSNLRVRAWT